VVVLNDTNFDSMVYESKDIWFVEFYAPWCGHCKKLEPEWNEAATALKGKIRMGKYDADANKGKGSKLGVNGFPTIKHWDYGLPKNDGNAKTWKGQTSAAALIAWGNDLVEEADITPEVYEITN
jgi:protein disulfide-isomerase A6